MKKKILLLASSLVVSSVSCLSIFLPKNIETLGAEEHDSSCVWNHYDEVEAKTGKHGSKEFWACCTHGTYVLEEPSSGQITDRGSFNGEYFDNLDDSDGRYIPQLGSTPILNGNNVTYGLYPQTNVNDSSLISALNALTKVESNGWYLYEDEYYAKLSANPYETYYKFDNGTTIVSGTTYWFKCEPITWNVLSNKDGKYYILSSVLLDAHRYNEYYSGIKYGHYCNNYEYSEIRAWLNNEFFNSAFTLGSSNIQLTNVDNSAATTESSSNPYVCNNTQDKLFLLSYKEWLNRSSSGSSTWNSRCKTTDWARARGAYCTTYESNLYNGYYWTRSPASDYSSRACDIGFDGTLSNYDVSYRNRCVRPRLSIIIA